MSKEIIRAYKTQVYPNNHQQTLFRMNCGASRWAFNYGLEKKQEAFNKKEKIPYEMELHKELNKLKKTDKLPWAYGVSKCSFQSGLRNCDDAFINFFRRCKLGVKEKGFPKFKSKKNDKQSFKLTGSIVILDGGYIKLPRIGTIKLSEIYYFPTSTKVLSATVSSHANKWFVSINTKEELKNHVEVDGVVGIDLGIKTLATCSDGTTFENPKALSKKLKRLKRRQRQLSRKKKGSKNRSKAKKKLAKLHYRIANIRKDTLHKATTKIVSENKGIVLEDLKVSNMMKNHCLAKAISDVGMFEFRRQLEYKAKWYGREIQFANTFYPSSRICCKCGWKDNDLKLSDRTFRCEICENKIDRDLNASINLKNLYIESSSKINALGDGSSVCSWSNRHSPSLKKESNGRFTYTLKFV